MLKSRRHFFLVSQRLMSLTSNFLHLILFWWQIDQR